MYKGRRLSFFLANVEFNIIQYQTHTHDTVNAVVFFLFFLLKCDLNVCFYIYTYGVLHILMYMLNNSYKMRIIKRIHQIL